MPVEVVLALGRWDQADFAVQATVVEPVDVLGDGDLEVDAGVDERRVRIAEQQGEVLAGAIQAILEGLGLTKEQAKRAPELVRSVLLALLA